MRRRSLIQSFLAWISVCRSAFAQTTAFPGRHDATLKKLAATVLPEELGTTGTDAMAGQFVRWVLEYRSGAEMQTGYGTTRVRYKPDSPAGRYLGQLERLEPALASGDLAARRSKIAEALEAANMKDLPFSPDGAHVVTDLMAFYYSSSEANDLAYGAAIGKDKCRTLRNSGKAPAELKAGGPRAAL